MKSYQIRNITSNKYDEIFFEIKINSHSVSEAVYTEHSIILPSKYEMVNCFLLISCPSAWFLSLGVPMGACVSCCSCLEPDGSMTLLLHHKYKFYLISFVI